MSARLTRSLGWSFLAATAYSLLSPMQLLAPNESFAWNRIGGAHRLYLTVVWDELPHLAALTLGVLLAVWWWRRGRTGSACLGMNFDSYLRI